MKDIFIAAPDGQAGGGMGRVKDYILRTPPDVAGQYRFAPLVTRDGRGAAFSLVLLVKAMIQITLSSLRRNMAVLHVNMGDRGSIVRKGVLVLCARTFGAPVVLHLHAAELEAFYAAANPLARWLIRWPFRAASSIVVLGEHFRQWVVTELTIDPRKVHILYNGVEVPTEARRPDQASDPQTLLFLGNLIERKGVSDLLHALSLLPKDVPHWRAILAGGGDIPAYQTLAAELGIADRVDFPGWADRSEVTRFLQDATALVLPSYDEGLPLVILEAMGMGLPVVCTPVGVIPEVLTDGETALFVDPGDRTALADRLATLLTDRALQATLSMRGKSLFDRNFSLQSFMTSLCAIYRDCCGVDYKLASPRVDALPDVSIKVP